MIILNLTDSARACAEHLIKIHIFLHDTSRPTSSSISINAVINLFSKTKFSKEFIGKFLQFFAT